MNFIIFLLGFMSGIFAVFLYAIFTVSGKESRKEVRDAEQDSKNL